MTEHFQAELFNTDPRFTREALVKHLAEATGRRVSLTLTRNRVTMISLGFSADRQRVALRMHEAFLEAPEAVTDALCRYIRTRRRDAWRVVADFAQGIEVQGAARSAPRMRAAGHVYDLRRIYDEVNREFFNGRARCRIGWGRAPARRRARRRRTKSIRYGSWQASTGTIRIHPLLDDTRVPRAFVRYIVFHEMLHSIMPAAGGAGSGHSPEFRSLEARFPGFDRMRRLSKELLDVLV